MFPKIEGATFLSLKKEHALKHMQI